MESTHERNKRLAQEIYDTVRKLVNGKGLEAQLPDDKIHGCVLIWFPADHHNSTAVATTALGAICPQHLMLTAEKLVMDYLKEANPLAS